jgi:LysM repeat protein
MKRHIAQLTTVLFILITLLAAPAHAQSGTVYVVRAGDSMTVIAARHGLTATQLAAANGLRWNAWVYVGQRLRIPGVGTAVSTSPVQDSPGGTYTIRPGDTLIGIAGRHGVTVSQLAAANGLRANAWVYVGQRLKIPGAATSTSPSTSPTAPTSSSGIYVVRPGDTLIAIAFRHRLTVGQLARANGLMSNSWVYTGQRLKIPGATTSTSPSTSPTPTAPAAPSTPPVSSPGGTYTVRPGDTLIRIATRHGVSVSRLAAANGLYTTSWVYVGQRLKIPDGSTPTNTTPTNPTPPANTQNNSGKWIDINLSTQTLTAYSGQAAAFTTRVSTGTWRTPTVAGTFHIYVKHVSTHMSGPGYSLPNVPYTMYFYRGYGLHGTYWHNNFGTPMSHGCVNLSTPDARWLFNWAPVGTKVVTHY